MKLFIIILFIIGCCLLIGLANSEWRFFGINVPFLWAAAIAALVLLYWLGRIGYIPYRLFYKYHEHKNAAMMEALGSAFYFLTQQRYDKMQDQAKKATTHPKYAALAYTMLAYAYMQTSQFDEAHAALDQARDHNACSLTIDALRCETLVLAGEKEQAQQLFHTLIEKNPTHSGLVRLGQRLGLERLPVGDVTIAPSLPEQE